MFVGIVSTRQPTVICKGEEEDLYAVEDLSCDETYSKGDFSDVAFDGEHKHIGKFP